MKGHNNNEIPEKKPYKKNNNTPQQQLDIISLAFLNTNASKYGEIEMEAKFGTRGIKPLT
jgi:hypothetical protein